jgi:exodeoxyribonuclease VII small subunit
MARKKKEDMTYQAAYRELEEIISSIQEDALNLDEMAESVRRAKTLIKFCTNKLHNIETEIHEIFEEKADDK